MHLRRNLVAQTSLLLDCKISGCKEYNTFLLWDFIKDFDTTAPCHIQFKLPQT